MSYLTLKNPEKDPAPGCVFSWTHWFLIGLLVVLFTFLLCGTASATPLTDAQNEEAAAVNKYYETIYSTPGMSRAEKMKLYNQLVSPAKEKLGAAISQALQGAHDEFFAPSKKLLERQPKSGVAGTGALAGKGKVLPQVTPDSGPQKPELVLDGKGIPSEIEFKGKSGSKSPAAAPSNAPGSAPILGPIVLPPSQATSIPGGGVNELNFSAGNVPAAVPSAGHH